MAAFKLFFVPSLPRNLVVKSEGEYFAVPPAVGGWVHRRKIKAPLPMAFRHWVPQQITAIHHHILPIAA